MKHRNIRWFYTILMSSLIIFSCSSQKNSGMTKNEGNMGVASPPAIVYKTSKDYYYHVPVQLSDDGKKVVSYPAPSDLRRGNDFTYPTRLADGYLLDNRGININTAFLRFTYADYYNMDNIPNTERLMNYIIDDDPFTEFYEVGRRGDYEDIEKALNKIIGQGKLKEFKNLAQ